MADERNKYQQQDWLSFYSSSTAETEHQTALMSERESVWSHYQQPVEQKATNTKSRERWIHRKGLKPLTDIYVAFSDFNVCLAMTASNMYISMSGGERALRGV